LGWSNGVDTRILRTTTTTWPLRTISQFTYGNNNDAGCSGTLIGPRHLITAAHCINAKGTNNWFTVRVTPARNGTNVRPYGDSVISPNPAPGTEVWYFTPSAWRNPSTSNHTQWDWGLIVIPDRLGNQTGWMGYVARSSSALKSVSNYNRGYPQCGTDRGNAPAGCQIARMYGDTNLCSIGGFYDKAPDNWHRRFSVSCDLSAGHSGSPVYHYFYDSKLQKYVPVVAGVVITESCFTCGPLDNFPNRARRITPGDLGTISWLREVFP
jgi:V8-like Glu-specific endopeptidase